MEKELHVNLKSSIEEFKRKHNWLVDETTIKIHTTDIKSLNTEQINSLKCGDIVLKDDESGQHAYIVTYKKDGVGCCLTYVDASIVETQSYDFVEDNWVYNSEDKTPLPINGKLEGDIEIDGDVTLADDATISGDVEFIGDLSFSGDVDFSGTVTGIKKLYQHKVTIQSGSSTFDDIKIITTDKDAYTTFNEVINAIKKAINVDATGKISSCSLNSSPYNSFEVYTYSVQTTSITRTWARIRDNSGFQMSYESKIFTALYGQDTVTEL